MAYKGYRSRLVRPNRFVQIAEREGLSVKELLLRAYDQHGTQTAVAAALGVSQSRVSQVIRDMGLTEKTILVEEAECQS
jgi:DNA-directed RNA polymerase specialized sigma subunit